MHELYSTSLAVVFRETGRGWADEGCGRVCDPANEDMVADGLAETGPWKSEMGGRRFVESFLIKIGTSC